MGRRPRRRAPQIAHECLRIRSVGRPSARSRVNDRTRVCRSERDILIGYKTPELLTLRHRLRMFEVPSQTQEAQDAWTEVRRVVPWPDREAPGEVPRASLLPLEPFPARGSRQLDS